MLITNLLYITIGGFVQVEKELDNYFKSKGIDADSLPFTEVREFTNWLRFLKRGDDVAK
jgi:hypothetical protein